jgi:hypothetical protein
MGVVPVRKRRSYKILLVLLLVFGIGANGVLAEACFCGQACLHGLQNKSVKQVKSLFHNRCSGTNCKGCNIENGQTLRTVSIDNSKGIAKIFYTAYAISALADYSSYTHPLEGFGSLLAGVTIPTSPFFQQNSPLLI